MKTLDQLAQGHLKQGVPVLYYRNKHQDTLMTLVAIFHSHYNHLPIVMEVKTYGKFIDCCGTVATDWAYLMNKESGEVLQTWRKVE